MPNKGQPAKLRLRPFFDGGEKKKDPNGFTSMFHAREQRDNMMEESLGIGFSQDGKVLGKHSTPGSAGAMRPGQIVQSTSSV